MIESYFRDFVTVIRPQTDTRGGEVGADIFYEKCRLEPTTRVFFGPDGRNFQLSYTIFMRKNANIQKGDRIAQGRLAVVSGVNEAEITDQQWPVVAISEEKGFTTSHLEVLC